MSGRNRKARGGKVKGNMRIKSREGRKGRRIINQTNMP
jgi:hypothetical protein